MEEAGTFVIARSGGVWRICKVCHGAYVLESCEGDGTKSVAVDGDEIVCAVRTREELQEIICRIPYIRTVQAPNDRIRRQLYDMEMEKYDEISWIAVMKSVYIRAHERRLMPMENDYAKRAKKYFYGEVSVVLGIPISRVEE